MQVFRQNKNGNDLKFEFKDNGIQYTLKDKTIHKSEFIPFENITNNFHEYFEKNDGHKSRAIYFLVVGLLFLGFNIIFKLRLWAWMFLIGAPVFYFLYKKSIVNYKVLNTEQGNMDMFVLDDSNQDLIVQSIYDKRNDYLKDNYLEISYHNDPNNEIGKFLWLKSLDIINEREFEIIREEIYNSN